jgi:hypothetical protein
MNGSTLQVRFMSGSSAQQDIAREQADWWAQVANLKFDFNKARKRTPRKPHFASEHDGSSLFGNVIAGVLHTVDLQPFAIQERDDAALVAQLDRGTWQGQ